MKIITAAEAAALLKDGITLGVGGFGAHSAPDELLKGIQARYAEEGHPAGITVLSGICTGDNQPGDRGHNCLCTDGLVDTVIAAHFKNSFDMNRLVGENRIAGFALPLGAVLNMIRAGAAGRPGVVTRVGINTYVDPRIEGCAVNERARSQGRDLVSVVDLAGEEYLFYKAVPVDACVIRGTFADEDGNISMEHEDILEAQYHMALAARRSGGPVIAQVERVVDRGSIPARAVRLHHTLVDYVVVAAPENHRQNYAVSEYHPELSGEERVPLSEVPPMPLNTRKVIARRAAMELKPDSVINLGIGIPSGVGSVANEEGLSSRTTLSLESGPMGGVPVEGVGFGSSVDPESMCQLIDNFDLYDGGGLDGAFLGLAEVDENGNVNVSRFGNECAGPGGFIDITQNTPAVCFMGGFTAGKSDIRVEEGKLRIVSDGPGIKFVKKVRQITFSADHALRTGQKILYITERAVFELTDEGMVLTEIAPGVDLQRDVLDRMEFAPKIAEDLKTMDQRIFSEGPMGLSF